MTNQLVYIDGELYHADDFSDEELAHYGVKGMKWGRRKLRQKNRAALDSYLEKSKKSAADYDNTIKDLKAKRKSGQIDRATYRKNADKAFYDFVEQDNRYANQYRDTARRNRTERRDAIQKNGINALREIDAYSSERGKAYRKFLSNDVNLARANGLSRGQAVRNAYTQFYTNQRLYDR